MTLVSMDGRNIEIDTSPLGKAEHAGLFVGTYSGNKTSIATGPEYNALHVPTDTGDISINGVPIPGSDVYPNDKVAAINSVSTQTGVVAVLGENRAVNSGVQGTTSGLVSGSINGVEITGFVTQAGAENTSANRAMLVKQVNAISGQTGVEAFDTGVDGTTNGGGVTLIAKDGRVITNNLGNGSLAGFAAPTVAIAPYILESDHEIVIANANADPSTISGSIWGSSTGFTAGTYGGGQGGQSLRNIDISTQEGANKAIKAIDNALTRVDQVRADLGALNNRLDFTINNLAGVSQNTSASRSRIEDADFAVETAALSRAQVLQQASTAMLAQANASPQQILSLLKN